MQINIILSAICAFAIFVPSLHAETANEREFKQMRAERDKAAAAVLEPINRRYQEGLERLSKRATAEPELAKAIQAELQVLGGTGAVTTAVPTEPAPATASAAGTTADKNTLRKLIEETEWVSTPRNDHTFLFRRGGTFTSNGSWGKYWAVEAPGVLMLYTQDPRSNRNAPYRLLRVNVAEKSATQDLKASTEGGGLSIKYVGPAKAGK